MIGFKDDFAGADERRERAREFANLARRVVERNPTSQNQSILAEAEEELLHAEIYYRQQQRR